MGFLDSVKGFWSSDGDYESADTYEDEGFEQLPESEDDRYDYDYDSYETNSGIAEEAYNYPEETEQPVSRRSASGSGFVSKFHFGRQENDTNADKNYGGNTQDNFDGQVVIHVPVSVTDDVTKITKDVMTGCIVLLNFESCTNEAERVNIQLFIAGVVFAMNGKFYKLSENLFIVIPQNFKIKGDIEDFLRSKGFTLN